MRNQRKCCSKNRLTILLSVLTVFAFLCGLCQTVYAEEANESTDSEINQLANESVMISYSGHVQNKGWVEEKYNGETVGTTGSGLRMEGLRIRVSNIQNYSGQVLYRSHIQTYGWESEWHTANEISGTVGESKRLEAVQIKLTGELASKFDVYYRVHSETFGWLDWAKNGEVAGTSGYSKRVEAIQIMLVDKGQAAPGEQEYAYFHDGMGLSYQTHVQTYGWQTAKTNGQMSGTQGESKRLEGIRISLKDCPYEGGIEYQSHVQTYGWEEDWKSDGAMSGTEGQSKRLEAIRIRLTGELAEKCDIYYRVHCQSVGWLGWAKNGEEAGTSGYSYRMEGIQILLLPKNARTFTDTTAYISKEAASEEPSWSVSEIMTNLSGTSCLVNSTVEFSARLSNTTAHSVQYYFTWKNENTGDEGEIGSCQPDGKIQWMPEISGTYTITLTAKDETLQEVRKQMTLEVAHGTISRSDAYFTAHRGLSSQAPDNSIPAFTLAGQNGFDSIETDVNETKDGVFILSHDNNLKNICGIDKNISDLTYEELKDYTTYHITSGANVAGYTQYELRLPTLEEYLDICAAYGCVPQIDTKNLNSFESVSRLYTILQERGIAEQVIITSFNNLYLQLLRELDPNLKLTYGVDTATYPDVTWLETYGVGASVSCSNLLSGDFSGLLDRGISVNAYAVNDEKSAGILLDKGIHELTTNRVLWK